MDVAIVGAGVSGLLTGYRMLENKKIDRVIIFEKRNLHPRKHCTGIVSRSTLERIPFSEKFIENSYSGIDLITIEGIEISIDIEKNSVYKFDRVAHEQYLAEEIIKRGGVINDKTYVTNIMENNKICVSIVKEKIENRKLNYDYVVIAEGYPPKLVKTIGFKTHIENLKGLQVDVNLSKKINEWKLNRLFIVTSFENFLNSFCWFVPLQDRKAVIGIAVNNIDIVAAKNYLLSYIKLFEKRLDIEIQSVENLYGGIVLRGYPINIVRNRILSLGDAVGTVKSLSGGGLYAISILSSTYGKNIHKSNEIEKEVKLLARELKQQYIMYKLLNKILAKVGINILKILKKKKITIEIKNKYYFDQHEKLLIKSIPILFKEIIK